MPVYCFCSTVKTFANVSSVFMCIVDLVKSTVTRITKIVANDAVNTVCTGN